MGNFGCKKTANPPVCVYLPSAKDPASCFVICFFTPPRRIWPLTRSCTADLYQRITAIPRTPPTKKGTKLNFTRLIYFVQNYLPEQLRQELGETPTSVGNPAASAAKSEHFRLRRRPNRLSGSNFFPFSFGLLLLLFYSARRKLLLLPIRWLEVFHPIADEAWRPPSSKNKKIQFLWREMAG
jgi:hypothetical protein